MVQKYWHNTQKTTLLLFNHVWSLLNIKVYVDVRSYFRGDSRSRSLQQHSRGSVQRCPFVCLKGSRIDGPVFWGMALTSRSGTCINHGPASFSASLLVTFVSRARDRGRSLSIHSQMSVYTSCQLSADNEQYINSFKMWQKQLSRRNLLKEEIDFGEKFKCLLWGMQCRKKAKLCLLNKCNVISWYSDSWTALSAVIQRTTKGKFIQMWYCLVLFLLFWETRAEIHWLYRKKIQFPQEWTCFYWSAGLS